MQLREAAYIATAKCMRAVGVDVCLPILSQLLLSHKEFAADASCQLASTAPSHRLSLNPKSPRGAEAAFSVGQLLALVAASLPLEQASPEALAASLLPPLCAFLLNGAQQSEDAAAAKAVLSLAARQVSTEALAELLREASAKAGRTLTATEAKEVLAQSLLPAKAVEAIVRSRRLAEMHEEHPMAAGSIPFQQVETQLKTNPTSRDFPQSDAAAGASRSQREGKAPLEAGSTHFVSSSGSRRPQQPNLRENFFADLRGRLNGELFEALFRGTPGGAPTGSGGSSWLPSVENLREVQAKWRSAFEEGSPGGGAAELRALFDGEPSVAHLLLQWISCW